ncbi:MAG TPA: RNA polymerase subunit sigma-70 [Gaiellaceae bacterium]|nr:RNA polymerase subunit sigma-70 [Gaiellaceae bacterium]
MELVTAARAGDEQAFGQLTAPLRRRLHAHCYRMLGSVHDADDALQETMLRAWRAIGRFEPRAEVSSWLYRIATNVCLRMIEQRGRVDATVIDGYLQPYPDVLLEERTPEDEAERRETIGLAFVAAMQLLPPKQRATLVLRDVLGWSAREAAETLDMTVAATNSALQRARERVDRERGAAALARTHRPADGRTEETLMRRFVEAWEAVDVEGMTALLAGDALMTMPPEPMHVVGPVEIAGFFATVPMDGRLDLIRLVPTRANGQPTLAAYVQETPAEPFRAYGLMVFALDGQRIAGITGFAGYPELFPVFELPVEI